MTIKDMLFLLCILLLIAFLTQCDDIQNEEMISGKIVYEPTWESLAQHETPEWYEESVLGIYFHWGPYSVPAFGCWGGRNMYMPDGGSSENWGHIDKSKYKNTYDYVKQVYGEPGVEFGYKEFVPMFKAEKWDPDFWAELFKESGADFAGPVAIHHDGFAMWDSEFAEYNSMDMGPKRDITGEMLDAVRKQGLKTLATFHQYTNWFYFNPGRKICPPGVDVNDPKYVGLYGPIREYKGDWQEYPFSEEFQQTWTDRVKEVISKYQPDQLWFEIGFSDEDCVGEEYVKSTLAHYFNTEQENGKEFVVTRKDDDLPLSCSVLNLEAHSEDEAQPVVWQTDIALGTNHAWAYSPDAVCRPINGVIDEIVDRKSKNGVTLLSLAPLPDGTLPPSQIKGMKELGKWMSINKEALHAAKCAPFNEGGIDQWKSGSIRFTEKGDYVYAIELGNQIYVEYKDEEPDEETGITGTYLDLDNRMITGGYPESTPPQVPYVIPNIKPIEGSKIMMLGSSESLEWHM
ncbi:MAG: alpha-L-fucosidase, partial [Melioribacteraceae bacterium]|nr:alpha-L-fucosidase [Melioribacteraceae bacterium]